MTGVQTCALPISAVTAATGGWAEADRALAAAMLDVLWSVPAYERLVADWELDPAEAIRGVTWVMGLVEDAIRVMSDHDFSQISITRDGRVKILDFGIAKLVDETAPHTITQDGHRPGTPAYMAPEQAKGKPIDKRADIWAFGVVLYEMLVGRQLFGGETASDVLARVITQEPDWNALPPHTPRRLRELLRQIGRAHV